MRLGILILLLIATLFGSGFWYSYIDTTCRAPVHYYIGEVDDRFGTSREEVRRILQNAEAMWEEPLSTELFVYDENGTLPVNFIFDERQENADLEAELREDLAAKEGMSESVAQQYERLIGEFRILKKQYESRVVAYEASLRDYNSEVTQWNGRGGAPEPVLNDLRETEASLKEEQGALETLAKKLNALADELNRIGARGNSLITDYNTIVEEYNEQFSTVREFAQGDFTHDVINIYQFDSEDELIIVLAHEFGHALSLDHVSNESSIMYYLLGAQEVDLGTTPEDAAEYARVCGQKSKISSFFRFVRGLF